MKITCIGHSGFLVELPELNLIFDYYTDRKNVITPELFSTARTAVFVSHSHADHYNKRIFDWSGRGDVAYILDSGCGAPDVPKLITVRENEKHTVFDGGLTVATYGSTDMGVSFLVNAGGAVIFHAGDLNDWYWEEESTPEELAADEEAYLRVVRRLAGTHIDVAFIPEDPRLGRNAGRGIKFFKEIAAPERVIPMHCPGNDGLRF